MAPLSGLTLQQHLGDTGSEAKVGFDLEKLLALAVDERAEQTEHVIETIVIEHQVNKVPGLLGITHACPEIDAPRV